MAKSPQKPVLVPYWEDPCNEHLDLLIDKDGKFRGTSNNFVSIMLKWPELAAELFKIFLDAEAVNVLKLDELAPTDGIFTDEQTLREARSDVLYTVPARDDLDTIVKIGILLEHKARKDDYLLFQVKKYIDQIHDRESRTAIQNGVPAKEFRYSIVIPVVLYHALADYDGPQNFWDMFGKIGPLRRFIPGSDVIWINLNRITDEIIDKARNFPELWFVLRILRSIMKPDLIDKLDAIFSDVEQTIESSENKKRFRIFGQMLVTFVTQTAHQLTRDQIKEAIYNNFKGDNRNTMSTVAEQIFEEGVSQGRQEGRQEGERLGLIRSIIRVLESKGIPVTDFVRTRLGEIRDEIVLESFLQGALNCSSIAEFEELLS